MRTGHMMMPGEDIHHDQGSGAGSASFPCFLPRLGGQYGQVEECAKGARNTRYREKFEGKIEGQPRTRAYLIVCTSFFGETPRKSGETDFWVMTDYCRFSPKIARLGANAATLDAYSRVSAFASSSGLCHV